MTLYLPETTLLALRAAAKRRGQLQTALVREAIDANLAHSEHPPLSLIGIFNDPSFQSDEIEEWLTENWRPT
ncbi:MAG: ribbon-helix-helix domain-containing protein [Chloroflexota bacterium]|nr:ribbon-helix-helix domain-containing protein [Chloroflexota bacterium]